MMGKTVLMVGSGNAIVEKAIAETAAGAGIDLIVADHAELASLVPPTHVIRRYEQPKIIEETPKPTCHKHHEYGYKRKEEISPNMFKEVWACIHCGKELK